MAKKDINITSDINSVGSRSKRIVEHEKALEVLEMAKKIPRKVVFVKQGEGEFTRSLERFENQEEMLSTQDAAAYLMISYYTFAHRVTKTNIPFQKKKGNKKFFKISDLDRFKSRILNT